jgi:transposase
VIADASGRAIGFALAPGQAHELPLAPLLLTLLSIIPAWIVADRGYASHAFRDLIWTLGARPAIPAKRNEADLACPSWIYHNRNRVERLWARLKEWRAVATRYEKTACCFMGVLCMAATLDWIKYRTELRNVPIRPRPRVAEYSGSAAFTGSGRG